MRQTKANTESIDINTDAIKQLLEERRLQRRR